MNKHVKRISNTTMAGGMSAVVIATMTGCGDANVEEKPAPPPVEQQSMVKEGATVTIEEKPVGTFKIIDEVPSVSTRVILKDENGTERILSQPEIDKLVKEEEAKVEAGTSDLTKSPDQVQEAGGLGLAGTLMASMAAGMVGAMLMNKLMNNQNYNQNRRTSYKSPSTYSKSQSSFSKARSSSMGGANKASSSSSTRSSGFGANKASTSKSSSFGG